MPRLQWPEHLKSCAVTYSLDTLTSKLLRFVRTKLRRMNIGRVVKRSRKKAGRLAKSFQIRYLIGDRGRNNTQEKWDRQYEEGYWDYLESVDQSSRFAICASFTASIKSQPSVLDMGCGTGILLDHLQPYGFSRYVGVDFSEPALERARARQFPKAEFEFGAFETWDSTDRFDVIVFSETLNYAESPSDTLLQFTRYLNEGGAMVVSLFQFGNSAKMWKSCEQAMRRDRAVRVLSDTGKCWDIKILRPFEQKNSRDT